MFLVIADEGIIGAYDSRDDAIKAIAEYEEADKAHGVFTENYYKVKEI